MILTIKTPLKSTQYNLLTNNQVLVCKVVSTFQNLNSQIRNRNCQPKKLLIFPYSEDTCCKHWSNLQAINRYLQETYKFQHHLESHNDVGICFYKLESYVFIRGQLLLLSPHIFGIADNTPPVENSQNVGRSCKQMYYYFLLNWNANKDVLFLFSNVLFVKRSS